MNLPGKLNGREEEYICSSRAAGLGEPLLSFGPKLGGHISSPHPPLPSPPYSPYSTPTPCQQDPAHLQCYASGFGDGGGDSVIVDDCLFY